MSKIDNLINDFHDYWSSRGHQEPRRSDNEKHMLRDFLAWLVGKGIVETKRLLDENNGELDNSADTIPNY